MRLLAGVGPDVAGLVLEAVEGARAEGTLVRPTERNAARPSVFFPGHEGTRILSYERGREWERESLPRDLGLVHHEALGGDAVGGHAGRIERRRVAGRVGREGRRVVLRRQLRRRLHRWGRLGLGYVHPAKNGGVGNGDREGGGRRRTL